MRIIYNSPFNDVILVESSKHDVSPISVSKTAIRYAQKSGENVQIGTYFYTGPGTGTVFFEHVMFKSHYGYQIVTAYNLYLKEEGDW